MEWRSSSVYSCNKCKVEHEHDSAGMTSGLEETNRRVLLMEVTQCTAEINKSGNGTDDDARAKIFVSLIDYMYRKLLV